MQINFKQIKHNITHSPNRKIEYIILHDTGNFKQGANAEMHFKYFNGGNRQSSADFFVDDSQVLKINDYKNNFTWAVGDGKGRYGITNRNSISVEICVNSDNDMDKTINKTIDLVIYLMKELNLPIERVCRHFNASRKNCPQTMNMGTWDKWHAFINQVKERMNPMKKIENVDEALKVLVENGVINSPDYWKTASNMVKYFDLFILNVANKLNEMKGVK